MASFDSYVANVRILAGDAEAVLDVAEGAELGAEAAERVLNLPGNIASYLHRQADTVDLPDALVSVLGRLPYGIGFAIRQLNSVSNTVGYTIDRQAAVFDALDAAWEPAQRSAEAATIYFEALLPTRMTFEAVVENQLEEADLLEDFMAGQTLPSFTELGTRMEAYGARVRPWAEARDALLGPARAAVAAMDAAIAAISDILSDYDEVQDIVEEALAVFTTAAGIARDIYNSLNITVEIWPVPAFNLIDAIASISDFVGFVQSAIEDIVVGILDRLGFDTNIFGGVQDEIDAILDPLFSTFAAIGSAAAELVATVTDAIPDMVDTIDELFLALGEAIGLGTLFASETVMEAPDGAGAETVGAVGEDAIFGTAGDDTILGGGSRDFLFGGDGADRLAGQSGSDEMFGGAGADTFLLGGGNDYADGGTGLDMAVLGVGRTGVTVIDAGPLLRLVSREGSDTFIRVEEFMLNGRTWTVQELREGADARVVTGGPGDNRLLGTDGDDTFFGNAGDDTMIGGAGGDAYDGGAGIDEVSYETSTRSVRIDLQNPRFLYGDAVGDTFTGVEIFRTGDMIDQLRGDAGANIFYGGGSTDRLYGRAGDDFLFGQAGTDALYGGLGADRMTGGSDARRDRYIYFNMAESGVGAGSRDIITDFVPGEDRIEISRLDADLTQGLKQRFTFVGDDPFSGMPGELGYRHEGGDTVVQADVDGDAVPDFEILLRGQLTLAEGDFFLGA